MSLVRDDPPGLERKVLFHEDAKKEYEKEDKIYYQLRKMSYEEAKEFMCSNVDLFTSVRYIQCVNHHGFPTYSINVAKVLADDDTNIPMHYYHIGAILGMLGEKGELELAKKILEKYPHDISIYGANELLRELFIYPESLECIKFFISKGAKVDDLCYALAVEYSNTEAVKLLEDLGYSEKSVIKSLEENPSVKHHLERFKYFLKQRECKVE